MNGEPIRVEDAYDQQAWKSARLYWQGQRIVRITTYFGRGAWQYSLKLDNEQAEKCGGDDLIDMAEGER